jgi:hypothetical protein
VKAGPVADEARRRSAEAVLRIREESRRRVVRARHRSCFSWCMVASLVGGISLAAMDAYDAHQRELLAEQAAMAQREEQAARAAAALEQERRARDLARRRDEKERALIRAQYKEWKALDDCGGPRSRTRRGTRRGS